jgi:hypothetical protein
MSGGWGKSVNYGSNVLIFSECCTTISGFTSIHFARSPEPKPDLSAVSNFYTEHGTSHDLWIYKNKNEVCGVGRGAGVGPR